MKKVRKILTGLVACIALAGLIAGTYCGSVLYIKKFGVSLKPSKEYPLPPDISVFLQNDAEWAEDFIGESRYKMAGHGCLVSVLARAIKQFGEDTDPGRLNKAFTKKGVYTSSGDVIWYKIKEAVPSVDYRYQRIFGRGRIEEDLDEGLLPIVMVKYHGTGINHWLLIVGADKEDFLVVDPLSSEIVPLSTHGRVYAYRVIFPQNTLQ